MNKQIISTTDAPAAIGTYSQAVRVGNTVWVSGQIPLDPRTKELVTGDVEAQIRQVFDNLKAIVVAAGATTIALRLSKTCRICASTSPVTNSLVRGSKGIWPDTQTVLPTRT